MYNLLSMTLTEKIKQYALQLGFDLAGVTDAAIIDADNESYFQKWLLKGNAASMDYLHKNLDKRFAPAKLLGNARSVIVTALNYKPHPAKHVAAKSPTGKVAAYAQYEDYHTFIKNLLHKLGDFITENVDSKPAFKFCVDSVPLAERALAHRAGLGFVGKNHMLINPTQGAQLLLAEIITDLKLDIDQPYPKDILNSKLTTENSKLILIAGEECKGCDKCIQACPTGALNADGIFDANLCISYLTQSNIPEIPKELAEKIGDKIFGCDNCTIACPYHRNAPVCRNSDFKFYPDRAQLNLSDILNMTQEQFDEKFFDSPIRRVGLTNMKRNANICLQNQP